MYSAPTSFSAAFRDAFPEDFDSNTSKRSNQQQQQQQQSQQQQPTPLARTASLSTNNNVSDYSGIGSVSRSQAESIAHFDTTDSGLNSFTAHHAPLSASSTNSFGAAPAGLASIGVASGRRQRFNLNVNPGNGSPEPSLINASGAPVAGRRAGASGAPAAAPFGGSARDLRRTSLSEAKDLTSSADVSFSGVDDSLDSFAHRSSVYSPSLSSKPVVSFPGAAAAASASASATNGSMRRSPPVSASSTGVQQMRHNLISPNSDLYSPEAYTPISDASASLSPSSHDYAQQLMNSVLPMQSKSVVTGVASFGSSNRVARTPPLSGTPAASAASQTAKVSMWLPNAQSTQPYSSAAAFDRAPSTTHFDADADERYSDANVSYNSAPPSEQMQQERLSQRVRMQSAPPTKAAIASAANNSNYNVNSLQNTGILNYKPASASPPSDSHDYPLPQQQRADESPTSSIRPSIASKLATLKLKSRSTRAASAVSRAEAQSQSSANRHSSGEASTCIAPYDAMERQTSNDALSRNSDDYGADRDHEYEEDDIQHSDDRIEPLPSATDLDSVRRSRRGRPQPPAAVSTSRSGTAAHTAPGERAIQPASPGIYEFEPSSALSDDGEAMHSFTSNRSATGTGASASGAYSSHQASTSVQQRTPVKKLPASSQHTRGSRAQSVNVTATSSSGQGKESSYGGAATPVSTTLSEEQQYISSADLKPFGSTQEAHSAMSSVGRALQSADWSVRFDAMTLLRRLIVRQSDVVAPSVKLLMKDVRAEVDSLRSSIAKNALMAITDLFCHLSRSMDLELDSCVPSLLKRAGESSGFLAEEAQKALQAMAENCNESKALNTLMTCSSTGNKVVKVMACCYIDSVLETCGTRVVQNRELLTRVLRSVGAFASDASSQSRQHAKMSLCRLVQLLGQSEVESQLQKILTPAQWMPVKKIIDRGDTDMLLMSPASPARQSNTHTSEFNLNGNSSRTSMSGLALVSPVNASAKSRRQKSSVMSSFAANSGGPAALAATIPPSTNASSYSNSGSITQSAQSDSAASASASLVGGLKVTKSVPNIMLPSSTTPSTGATADDYAAASSLSSSASLGSAKTPTSRRALQSATRTKTSTPINAPLSAALQSSEESQGLQNAAKQCSDPDWRTRQTAINEVMQRVVDAQQSSSQDSSAIHLNLQLICDALLPRLLDGNSKVSLLALQHMPQLIDSCSAQLSVQPSVCHQVFHALMPLMGSSQESVSSGAHFAREMIENVLPWSVVLPCYNSELLHLSNVSLKKRLLDQLYSVLVRVAAHCTQHGSPMNDPQRLAHARLVLPLCYQLTDPQHKSCHLELLKLNTVVHAVAGEALQDEKLVEKLGFNKQQQAIMRKLLGT